MYAVEVYPTIVRHRYLLRGAQVPTPGRGHIANQVPTTDAFHLWLGSRSSSSHTDRYLHVVTHSSTAAQPLAIPISVSNVRSDCTQR